MMAKRITVRRTDYFEPCGKEQATHIVTLGGSLKEVYCRWRGASTSGESVRELAARPEPGE